MIECPIPQDILKYKTKFVAGFSVRETVCLGLGGFVGLCGFFFLFKDLSQYPRIYLSAALIVPFFLFGFLKPLGQPLEKILLQIIYDNFVCPQVRKYEIRYPEYEKYTKSNLQSLENNLDSGEDTEEDFKKRKRKKTKKKKKDIKVARSKEYKAIL